MTTPRTTANGVDFAYLEAGPPDGPLALCLHGFPDHAHTFEALLADLADAGFHAVAPWMRGYAPTGPAPDGNYETAALATDALALADALAGDGDAVVVGHDWGAVAAYIACASRPERFRRLVAAAVPPPAVVGGAFLTRPDQLKLSWYMFFFQHPLADAVVPNDDFAFVDMLWRDWSPGYEPPAELMKALKETFSAPGTLGAALGYYRAMLGGGEGDPALADVRAAGVGPIPVPTLYLQGDRDGCMAPDLATEESMAPWFPRGLEFEVVEGAGHFLHLERPGVVNPRIVGFLAGP